MAPLCLISTRKLVLLLSSTLNEDPSSIDTVLSYCTLLAKRFSPLFTSGKAARLKFVAEGGVPLLLSILQIYKSEELLVQTTLDMAFYLVKVDGVDRNLNKLKFIRLLDDYAETHKDDKDVIKRIFRLRKHLENVERSDANEELSRILLAVQHNIPLHIDTLSLISTQTPAAKTVISKQKNDESLYASKPREEDGIHKIFTIMLDCPYDSVLEVGLDSLIALTARRTYWKTMLTNTPCVKATLLAMAQYPYSRPIQFRACKLIGELSGDSYLRKKLVQSGALGHLLDAYGRFEGDNSFRQICLFCITTLCIGRNLPSNADDLLRLKKFLHQLLLKERAQAEHLIVPNELRILFTMEELQATQVIKET